MAAKRRFERFAFHLWITLACLLALAVRVPLLDRPLDRDEGLYAYMAQRMHRGEVPYRDVFSDKPPVGFGLYWLFFRLFGETVPGAHVGGAAWCALSTVLLGLLARRLGGEAIGAAAALFYAVGCADPGVQGSSVNLEILLTPFALTACLIAARERQTVQAMIACGALLALAGLTKQQAIGHAAFALLLVLGCGTWKGVMNKLGRILWVIAGGILVLGLTLGLFAALGALPHFLDGVLWYNLNAYVRREPPARAFANLTRTLQDLFAANPVLYACIAVGLASIVRRDRRSSTLLLVAWWALNAAAAAIGFRFYRHYFLLARPAECGLAALGAVQITEWMRRRPSPWSGPLVATLLALTPLPLNSGYFFTASDEEFVEQLYGPEIFAWSDELAAEMAARSRPDQAIYVSGSEPQIYFLARRRCAGRYAFIHPLTTASRDVQVRVREALASLRAEQPPVILVVVVPMSTLLDPRLPPYYERAFAEFVRGRYQPELALVRGPDGRHLIRGDTASPLRLTRAQTKACDALLMVRMSPAR